MKTLIILCNVKLYMFTVDHSVRTLLVTYQFTGPVGGSTHCVYQPPHTSTKIPQEPIHSISSSRHRYHQMMDLFLIVFSQVTTSNRIAMRPQCKVITFFIFKNENLASNIQILHQQIINFTFLYSYCIN